MYQISSLILSQEELRRQQHQYSAADVAATTTSHFDFDFDSVAIGTVTEFDLDFDYAVRFSAAVVDLAAVVADFGFVVAAR